jgi:signal transduction histidine kinase
MTVFLDILNLLTGSPGAMVYYLVLMFSIWAMVGLALSRWTRGERRDIVPRLLVAGALMSFSRFLPMIVALLDLQGGVRLIALGPPLERFIETLSTLLICWAFVAPRRYATAGRVLVGAAVLLALGLYAIDATQWANTIQADPAATYNSSWQRWIWELGQFALLTLAVVYLFVQGRGILGVSFGLLAIGHLLQAIVPLPQEIPHFAGWVRFANLLAFPLLAVSTYHYIIERFDVQATQLKAVGQESLSQITGLMALLDTSQKMTASLELDAVLDSVMHGISQGMQSSLCAVALVPPGLANGPDEHANSHVPDELELAIVYHAPQMIRQHTRFTLSQYPAVHHAITRGKPVVLSSEPGSTAAPQNGQLAQTYHLLGSEQVGPLIVQPLQDQSYTAGVLIICRPGGEAAPFTQAQVHKIETLATHITSTISNACLYQQIRERVETYKTDLRLLEVEYSRTKADLENRLEKSKQEIALYIQKLYDTELGEQRAQEDARQAHRDLVKLKEEAQAELDHLRAELKQSIKQNARFTQKIAELDAQRARLEEQIQAMEEEKNELQFQLAVNATMQPDFLLDLADEQQPLPDQHSRVPELVLSALEGIASGVILCDHQAKITHLNTTAAQLLDGTASQWIGRDAAELWPDAKWHNALQEALDNLESAADRPDEWRIEVEIGSFEQQGALIQAVLAPLHTTAQHAGVTITLYDIRLADERLRARDEFLASLAQDLRTPMTSILGYTELLMNESVGKLEGIQRRFLQRVQANIERMGGMLNDLIGITAIDSGKLILEMEPVNVANVIETALHKAQFRIEEKELKAHLEIDSLPVVFADADSIQQVIDNLLANACKSSQPKSTIVIQARVQADKNHTSYLHVAVSDTGGGIAPEDRPRVFDRFYRAESALISGLGETGVGLAIVKALVEAHSGHVWSESEMGVGTTFHFTIPIAQEIGIGNRGNGRG